MEVLDVVIGEDLKKVKGMNLPKRGKSVSRVTNQLPTKFS